jgi:hypothetical protein
MNLFETVQFGFFFFRVVVVDVLKEKSELLGLLDISRRSSKLRQVTSVCHRRTPRGHFDENYFNGSPSW